MNLYILKNKCININRTNKMAEEILIKLAMIASIKKGETLSTSYEKPVLHNCWSTSFSRTYNGEHRKKTISHIKSVLDSAVLLLNDMKTDKEGTEILLNTIKEALLGVENLKTTYKGDYYVIGLINTLIDEITIAINKNDIVNTSSEQKEQKEPKETMIVNTQLNDVKKTKLTVPFIEAIKKGDYDTIEDYLYDGNDPNVKTESMKNGLHYIAKKHYYNSKIIDILLNFNVDVNIKDSNNQTPLHIAIATSNVECVLKLEEYISKKKRQG